MKANWQTFWLQTTLLFIFWSAHFYSAEPSGTIFAKTNDLFGRPIIVKSDSWKPSYVARTNSQGQLTILYPGDSTNAVPVLNPIVEIDGDRAVAKNARHKVWFKANLNEDGAVTVQTDDGKVLRGRPVALSVSDGNGNRVWLGEAKDTEGEIVGEESRQVLYPDAFTGIRADVLFTHDLNTFEQDVVLREKPVLPAEIDESTARLEVWSVFQNPPEPTKTTKKVKIRDADPFAGKPEIFADDETLDFGAMRMGRGAAFYFDGGNHLRRGRPRPVTKLWMRQGDEYFLVEAADYVSLKPELDKLVVGQATAKRLTSATNLAFVTERSTRRSASSATIGIASFKRKNREQGMLMALGSRPGVVIDYTLVYSSVLNINFGSGHTGSAAFPERPMSLITGIRSKLLEPPTARLDH